MINYGTLFSDKKMGELRPVYVESVDVSMNRINESCSKPLMADH